MKKLLAGISILAMMSTTTFASHTPNDESFIFPAEYVCYLPAQETFELHLIEFEAFVEFYGSWRYINGIGGPMTANSTECKKNDPDLEFATYELCMKEQEERRDRLIARVQEDMETAAGFTVFMSCFPHTGNRQERKA